MKFSKRSRVVRECILARKRRQLAALDAQRRAGIKVSRHGTSEGSMQ